MATETEKNLARRERVFVGALPTDFLRINNLPPQSLNEQQEAADAQAAMALQQQMVGVPYTNNAVGRLTLTIVQAKLVKNYGMTRMDPYVRIRVGHSIYETNTDSNGGKNPKWNRDIQCLLPQGVQSIYLEIFDECSFTMDELIAWAQITIPPNVLKGETYEDWFPLSGKQGEGLEGMMNMVLSYSPVSVTGAYGYYPTLGVTPLAPVIIPSPGYPGYGMNTFRSPVPVAYAATPVPPPAPLVTAPPPPQPSAEDLKQIEEMFPNMDKEVVRSVYELNRFRKDLTVNSLLQMVD